MTPPTAPPNRDLPPQEDLTPEQWRSVALFLFNRLDDIDTMSDIAKADDQRYRKAVEKMQHRRFEVSDSDGYQVVFFPPAE